ncbi:MAG TPA: molybdopterin-dependent oxidoreductase, partial [Abditibacterium sp.]
MDEFPTEKPEAESETAPREIAPAAPTLVADVAGDDAETQMRRLSRRSFLWATLAGAGTLGGFRWLSTRRPDDGIPWPLRRVLDVNGEIARDLFSTARLAPTFPASRAKEVRVNGSIGMDGIFFDPAEWKLSVKGLASGEDLELSLAQIKKLPRVEFTVELKCIEGWATVVTWAGARLVDFMAKYPPVTQSGEKPDVLRKPTDLVPYVGAQTPDGLYYVGLDMESALHPQTLLCYEMNGKPLTLEHGAPLRLVTPTKYGI